jgi:hypothetical protein
MKNFLAASAAYGACLNRRVALGARLVAGMGQLLIDQSRSERSVTMIHARELQEQLRLNEAELTRLRRILQRALRAAKP